MMTPCASIEIQRAADAADPHRPPFADLDFHRADGSTRRSVASSTHGDVEQRLRHSSSVDGQDVAAAQAVEQRAAPRRSRAACCRAPTIVATCSAGRSAPAPSPRHAAVADHGTAGDGHDRGIHRRAAARRGACAPASRARGGSACRPVRQRPRIVAALLAAAARRARRRLLPATPPIEPAPSAMHQVARRARVGNRRRQLVERRARRAPASRGRR